MAGIWCSGLCAALGLTCGEMIAFVGAGGKTTAAWRVLNELADGGEPGVLTTTTRVFKPRSGAVELMVNSEPSAEEVARALEEAPRVMWGARIGERGDPEQAARSPYPAEPLKLVGPTPGAVNRLSRELPGVTWLVEADGASGRLLKAPAAHEPVIPSESDRVIIVAGLGAIGRPLDAEIVHRPKVAARLLGVDTGVLIAAEMIADLVADPCGGAKGIPWRSEAVVMLTQWNGPSALAVEHIAERILRKGRFTRVVQTDLRARDPAVAFWSD